MSAQVTWQCQHENDFALSPETVYEAYEYVDKLRKGDTVLVKTFRQIVEIIDHLVFEGYVGTADEYPWGSDSIIIKTVGEGHQIEYRKI